MNTFRSLTDVQLLQIYSQSLELNISPAFVLMLQKEIHSRNLLNKITPSNSALEMDPKDKNFE